MEVIFVKKPTILPQGGLRTKHIPAFSFSFFLAKPQLFIISCSSFIYLVPKPLAKFLLRLFVSRAVQMRWDRRLGADQVDEDCSGEGCPKSTLVSPQELSPPPSPFVAIFL